MTFELIFLTILVVGIVMVSIGLMRHVRSVVGGYLQRGLRGVDIGASYVTDEIRGGYRAFKSAASGYRALTKDESETLEQQILEIRTRPGLTEEGARREIRELPLYQRQEKARGLQEVTGRLYAGVGGENETRGSLYKEMMDHAKVLGIVDYSKSAIGAISDKAKSYAESATDAIGNWINRTIGRKLRSIRRWYGR